MNKNQDTKTFKLSTLLSVTSGRLLDGPGRSGDRTENLFNLLTHMTKNDNITDLRLGGDTDKCKPSLVQSFPELFIGKELLDALDKQLAASPKEPFKAIENWIGDIKKDRPEMKDEYEISALPSEDQSMKADDDRGMGM